MSPPLMHPEKVPASSQFGRIDREARAMTANSPSSVQVVTNDLLLRFLFGCTDSTLRQRLFKSQWSYLTTHEEQVDEATLPPAINNLANALSLPSYQPVTPQLIARVRAMWLPLMPSVLSSPEKVQDLGGKLSPVAAAMLSLGILQQKITNPLFKESATEFLRQTAKLSPPSDQKKYRREFKVALDSNSQQDCLLAHLQAFAAQLNVTDSREYGIIMQFFDTLHLSR